MSWRHRIRQKKLPKGFELIETQLEKFEDEMREIMNDTMEDKMRNELTWKVHKLHWKKNRFIFNLYYKEKAISKELFDFLVKEKVVDANLISKWRKPGYENLCSLAVISKTNTNFRTAGVCRVPLKDRHGQITPNVLTGCISCASGDGGPIWWDDPIPDNLLRKLRELGQLPPEEGTVDEAEEKQSDEEKAETEEGQLTDKTFEEEKGETREETTQDSERTKRRKKE
ncbi:G10 family protein [Galdieria sulphuraria]|uniref:G10 family protein n=1 Tax=Galdieria sulphuraria TaxID=130081 RepID=M2XTT1_GALSU|nr:G10 family protein [Galdieria sulphuraria]EME26819.1 G10 family protein [Galdieria sulphuraria]|eukprot:XP_005703339.1 G10 family protein [Galdieria sulphuraria]